MSFSFIEFEEAIGTNYPGSVVQYFIHWSGVRLRVSCPQGKWIRSTPDTIRKVCLCAGMTFEPKTDNLVRS